MFSNKVYGRGLMAALIALIASVVPAQATQIKQFFDVELTGVSNSAFDGTYAGFAIYDDTAITGVGSEFVFPGSPAGIGGLFALEVTVPDPADPVFLITYTMDQDGFYPTFPELYFLDGAPVTIDWAVGDEFMVDFSGPTVNLYYPADPDLVASGPLKFTDSVVIPEPAAYMLIGTGLAAIGLLRRRQRN